ncbi:hypothetical protein V8F33_000721 [Rhypophila sp. PSN 637]
MKKALFDLVNLLPHTRTIILVSSKRATDELADSLYNQGISCASMHSDRTALSVKPSFEHVIQRLSATTFTFFFLERARFALFISHLNTAKSVLFPAVLKHSSTSDTDMFLGLRTAVIVEDEVGVAILPSSYRDLHWDYSLGADGYSSKPLNHSRSLDRSPVKARRSPVTPLSMDNAFDSNSHDSLNRPTVTEPASTAPTTSLTALPNNQEDKRLPEDLPFFRMPSFRTILTSRFDPPNHRFERQ